MNINIYVCVYIYSSASQHPPPCLFEDGCCDIGLDKVRVSFWEYGFEAWYIHKQGRRFAQKMEHPQGRHAISFASHINTYMRAMAARLSGKSSRGLENLAKAGEKGTCSRKELLRTLWHWTNRERRKWSSRGIENRGKLKFWKYLGRFWSISSGTGRHVVENSSKVGAKMAEAWAKLVVGCDPDGPRYLQDEPC